MIIDDARYPKMLFDEAEGKLLEEINNVQR